MRKKKKSLILIIHKAHHFKGVNEQMKGWEFEICFLNQTLTLKQPWYQTMLPLISPIPPFSILLFALPLALCQLKEHCPGFPLFLPSNGLVLKFPADKLTKLYLWDLSGSLVAKNLCFQGRGPRFSSWSGNWDHICPVAQRKSKTKFLKYLSWVQLPQALSP